MLSIPIAPVVVPSFVAKKLIWKILQYFVAIHLFLRNSREPLKRHWKTSAVCSATNKVSTDWDIVVEQLIIWLTMNNFTNDIVTDFTTTTTNGLRRFCLSKNKNKSIGKWTKFTFFPMRHQVYATFILFNNSNLNVKGEQD